MNTQEKTKAPEISPQQMVQANLRQQSRLCWKRREALDMAASIKAFFDDNELQVPPTKYEYNRERASII